jgi:hypothetical protein
MPYVAGPQTPVEISILLIRAFSKKVYPVEAQAFRPAER